MFKCPVCGNTKKFICDVVGVAKYDQDLDSIGEVDAVDFNFENGHCCCLECKHQAPIDSFDSDGD